MIVGSAAAARLAANVSVADAYGNKVKTSAGTGYTNAVATAKR